jgi:MinD-like ATPase involved in chromosome partitioning or flagellar assembly
VSRWSVSSAPRRKYCWWCDEPTSITDAYALIKLLNRDYGMNRFRVLANMAQSPQEGATCSPS